ncbi:iron complex transport system substrate-binding protein [Nocardiopsis mwathae]|uniref:Iron complex transport system substrate-binding protein n=1 Tax=Nocardiopsis mwathae TaxID=1472723 RepID=A0A7X0D965_9ACTN|nr:ABC transporter substrate-binding protein [Nocardiopsis mwathae]MBB6174739.1 iron complex transport system substrate-binding protein [Nocardiopsis mwathae]
MPDRAAPARPDSPRPRQYGRPDALAAPAVPRRRVLLGGVLAAVASPLFTAGCGRAEPTGGADGRTVTDLAGEDVALSGPVERVVTIPLPAASMVVAVNGGPDVLVGMNSASRTAIEDSYLGEVYPELLDVSTDVAGAEFAPNIESVMALEPDVVIQWGDRGPGLVDPLRDTGIPVAQLTYGTQEDLEGAITLYGELLGKEERSGQMVDTMHERLRRLGEELPEPGERPSVLYVRGADDSLEAGAGASYNHFVIDLVGGRNPAADLDTEWATIDVEQLLEWDPDILLVGNFGPATPDAVYDDPALASLSAVRERRVYKVPLGGYRWDPPSQESPLMWSWLAGLVHDSGAPGLRQEVVDTYAFLYGAEPTDAQLDTILNAEANSGSRGYDEFGR